ncbi:MAG: hypothetical protein HQL71_01225 [Magnetococcales bacterium]|nr:hypothetical protein [Magnetococcales bacterium]
MIMGLFLLSSCSQEVVTGPKELVAATTGCFSASFSKAKNSHVNDPKLANQKFIQELYPCLVWKILGKNAEEKKKRELSDKLKNRCAFTNLEVTDKKQLIWCLVGEASPFVQENHDRLISGKTK